MIDFWIASCEKFVDDWLPFYLFWLKFNGHNELKHFDWCVLIKQSSELWVGASEKYINDHKYRSLSLDSRFKIFLYKISWWYGYSEVTAYSIMTSKIHNETNVWAANPKLFTAGTNGSHMK